MADGANDVRHLRRCLALARRADGRTSPNPIVGCVIVAAGRGGEVLAEGWHRRAGLPHAEAEALAALVARGGRARGATLYVNLEPCAHRGAGRRTQPCVPAIIAAGVKRVVYGLRDPFPGHGGGVEQLRAAGIRVDGPLLEEECRRANEWFVTYATERRAHFTLKAAMTLDGRIATASGESRWITGEAARHDAHRRRDRADAILVGAGTVAADDPLLTVRGMPRGRDPVRLVLDGRLRLSPAAKLLHSGSPAPTVVVTTADAPEARARRLARAGAEILRLPTRRGKPGGVDLRALGEALAARGLLRVLVEGGAATHAALLAAGLCDRLLVYVAPRIMGGARALGWVGGQDLGRLADAHQLRFDERPRRLGDDLLLEAVPLRTA